MVSCPGFKSKIKRLIATDDFNSDKAVCNDFPANYISRMTRYDTQAAYRGTVARGHVIITSYRMNCTIDPCRPRQPSLQQCQHLRQGKEVQAMRAD